MKNAAYFFITAISIVFILISGQSLIIPFLLGLLLWFMGRETKAALNKIPFIRNKFPSIVKEIIAVLIMVFALGIVFNVILSNINSLQDSYQKYEPNLDAIIEKINKMLGVDLLETVKGHSGDINFGNILTSLFNSLSDLIGNTFMIILYSLFILLEESNFTTKLEKLFTDKKQFLRFEEILVKIENSISNYLRLKALVSLITGLLSYFALQIIGVESPAFWAFLIFVLNFIPTIGSLIGTVFPAIFCLLQFGEIWPCVLVLLVVGTIQLIVGNIIEPKLMGSSMNISPLVTILALSFWGALWGIIGMILSVPITVVLIIIFSQFESTRKVAILLSEKGEIR